jgi:hypothetical protein
MKKLPTKLFYFLYAIVLWVVFSETSARVHTPLATGLSIAVAVALLWPFRRWGRLGWWRVPAGFVLGWLAELVWEHGLQSVADQTPLWLDNVMLLCSLVFMAWLFVRYWRKDIPHQPRA